MDVTLMPMTPNLEPLELLVEGLNEDCIFNLLPGILNIVFVYFFVDNKDNCLFTISILLIVWKYYWS